MGSAHASFTMAGIVAAGGLMGYARKRSIPSLVAGLAFGGLFALSGMMIRNGQDYHGHVLAAATSSVLVLAMGPRALKSRKFMPAGLVATLGAVSTAYQTNKALEWKDQ